jgi:hypothetical protein
LQHAAWLNDGLQSGSTSAALNGEFGVASCPAASPLFMLATVNLCPNNAPMPE